MRKGENIRERAFRFASDVVALCDELAGGGFSVRRLAGQLLGSGTSIGANLEEADAGQSRADFISKCSIALKEARETHYWLRLLRASGQRVEDRLLNECDELIAILTTIVKKSRGE